MNRGTVVKESLLSKCRKRVFQNRTDFRFLYLLFALCIPLLIRDVDAVNERGGHFDDYDHLGEAEFSFPIYSEYYPRFSFSEDPDFHTYGMTPVYKFARDVLHTFYDDNRPVIPPGYLIFDNGSLAFGTKVAEHSWTDLIAQNKLVVLFWILPLLILIVLTPFIGVCYFCLGCYRFPKLCAPCARSRNVGKRICCSILLFIIILGFMCGVFIAFLANRHINQGVHYASKRMYRGTQNTCEFFKDIGEHVNHIFVKNFDELKDHLIEKNSRLYMDMYLQLTEYDEGDAIEELDRIFENIPVAWNYLKKIDELEQELFFFAAQYRDSMRGVKREVIDTTIAKCGVDNCYNYLKRSGFLRIDTSTCLHLDRLPNTKVYIKALETAMDAHLGHISKEALVRFDVIGDTFKKVMKPMKPSLIFHLNIRGAKFRGMSKRINGIIDDSINEIYLRNQELSQTIDSVYNVYGFHRHLVNCIVCLLLLFIVVTLMIGLISGLCCRRSTAGSISMLLSIILIFAGLSFITLVGTFYFIIGLVTYRGACKHIFNEHDSERLIVFPWEIPNRTDISPMSKTLLSCREHNNIFKMLHKNGLFDIYEINNFNVSKDYEIKWNTFKGDLNKVFLLTPEEVNYTYVKLNDFMNYSREAYKKHLCLRLTPRKNLKTLTKEYYQFGLRILVEENMGDEMNSDMWLATSGFLHTYRDMTHYIDFEPILRKIIRNINNNLFLIDYHLLGDHRSFAHAMKELISTIKDAEKYIQNRGVEFINGFGKQLSDNVETNIHSYKDMLLSRATSEVGNCKALDDFYSGDNKYICGRIFDPVNGFWLGVLLCSLLCIPLLFVAHSLIPLYRAVPVSNLNSSCPNCRMDEPSQHPIHLQRYS